MTAARLFGVLLLATGALALSALFATRLAHTVSAPRHATAAQPSPPPSRTRRRRPPPARPRRTRRHPHARSRQHAHARPRRDHRRRTHGSRAVGPPRHAAERRAGADVFGGARGGGGGVWG